MKYFVESYKCRPDIDTLFLGFTLRAKRIFPFNDKQKAFFLLIKDIRSDE